MGSEAVLQELRRALARQPNAVAVGFSGGVDSSVLLAALVRLRQELAMSKLRAIHVQHGLMPGAEEWAEHARRVAQGLGVDFLRIDVDATALAGESPEAVARQARYRAFRELLQTHEVLCLAQHADDQVETFLIQLLRGSGPRGLAAMPRQRPLGAGHLLRPLLAVGRAQILDCARDWDLAWVEDESNRDPRFLRTRVRHELLPLLRRIRPGVDAVLERNAELQAQAWHTLASLAVQDMAICAGPRPGTLSRSALAGLQAPRRQETLRYWLGSRELRPPGRRALLELDRQLLSAGHDRCIRLRWRGAQVLTHGDAIYAVPEEAIGHTRHNAGIRRWHWDPEQALRLAHGILTATLRPAAGLRQGGALEVRTGESGVRCRPAGHAHSAPLTELLRRHHIPTWERPELPLLYLDGELAAVADLFICEGFQAREGSLGLVIGWQARWRQRSGYLCKGAGES